jgi:hypothetical protein
VFDVEANEGRHGRLDPAIRVLNVSKKVVDARVTKREDALPAFARA